MTSHAAGRRAALFAAACAGVLAAYNNVVSHLPGYSKLYVPLNLAATGLLSTTARRHGLSSTEMGLGPGSIRRGMQVGGPLAVLVATSYLAALRSRARPLLRDERVPSQSRTQIAYQAGVRIPLGTVVWEEVAFRGVLLGALGRVLPMRHAILVKSLVFGVWHIRPAHEAIAINRPGIHPAPAWLGVAGAVVGTAVGGALLGHLRVRSRSLITPALLHLATNSLGALAAAAAQRRDQHDRHRPTEAII